MMQITQSFWRGRALQIYIHDDIQCIGWLSHSLYVGYLVPWQRLLGHQPCAKVNALGACPIVLRYNNYAAKHASSIFT